MSYDDYQLPFAARISHSVLSTPRESGVVVRRRRFPRPVAQASYEITFEKLTQADLAAWIAIFDTAKGSALTFSLTLPDVGAKTVRLVDGKYSYGVSWGEWRTLSFAVMTEPEHL